MRTNCLAAAFAAALSAALAGCATLTGGTHEDITIRSNPSGATCSLYRGGRSVGTVESTPGKVHVRRTSDDLTLTCHHEGYADASQSISSDLSARVFGNAIVGGVIGVVVDASTGAYNAYSDNVSIDLAPLPASDSISSPHVLDGPDTAAQNQQVPASQSAQAPMQNYETWKAVDTAQDASSGETVTPGGCWKKSCSYRLVNGQPVIDPAQPQ